MLKLYLEEDIFDMDMEEYRTDLIELCNLAIDMLEKAKRLEVITEAEYNDHIQLKKKFLYDNKSA